MLFIKFLLNANDIYFLTNIETIFLSVLHPERDCGSVVAGFDVWPLPPFVRKFVRKLSSFESTKWTARQSSRWHCHFKVGKCFFTIVLIIKLLSDWKKIQIENSHYLPLTSPCHVGFQNIPNTWPLRACDTLNKYRYLLENMRIFSRNVFIKMQ